MTRATREACSMNQAKCGFISGAPPVTSTVSMPGRAATASTASNVARSMASVRCGPASTWQCAQARLQRAPTLTWIVEGSSTVRRQASSSMTSSKYTELRERQLDVLLRRARTPRRRLDACRRPAREAPEQRILQAVVRAVHDAGPVRHGRRARRLPKPVEPGEEGVVVVAQRHGLHVHAVSFGAEQRVGMGRGRQRARPGRSAARRSSAAPPPRCSPRARVRARAPRARTCAWWRARQRRCPPSSSRARPGAARPAKTRASRPSRRQAARRRA